MDEVRRQLVEMFADLRRRVERMELREETHGGITVETGAPDDAEYLTLALDATLTQERRFQHDTTLKHTDAGANGDYTLGIADAILAELGLLNQIYVWHADGSALEHFDLDDAGLTAAFAATDSGDTVVDPSCTISGDHTVPASVALVGLSREQSILTGQLTLSSGSIVINVGIVRTGTSANLTCLVGPGSGAARAVSCRLSVTTTSGTPLAASASGANTLYLEDCDIAAIKNGSAVTPFAASGETIVDTFAIDSTDGSYQSGAYTTLATKLYRVEVSGAVNHSPPPGALADSAYLTWDNFATYTAVNTISFSDLHGGGTCPPDNPAYASSHVYNFTRTGNGALFSMRFADVAGWYNNAGSFTVNVYEISGADVNIEGCVFNGAWSGISEWGDRAVRDALVYPDRHTNDIDTGIHWTRAELDSLYSASPSIEWFNVKTYGAVGDGAADDTFSISSAIASIPAAGGVLYFPAGNYLVSSGFTLAASITVRGDGSPQGLVEGPVSKISFTSATESLFTVTSHGCSFKDICLINTAGTTPSAGAGITVQAGNIANYDNVIILRFWIDIDMQDDATVWSMNHCTLANPIKYALKIANASNPDAGDWNISNCTFVSDSAADAAIRLESSGGGKMTNVKIIGGAAIFVHGIDVNIAAGDATTILIVTNSSIEWVSGDGIHVRNTTTSSWHQIIIHGVQFGLYSNTGGHAVSVVGVSAQHLEDVIVDACIFRATGSPGSAIDLQYVDRAFIGTYINDGFSSLLTTSNTTDIKQIGLGSGSVTSIATGTGLTGGPITTTGTISDANTGVAAATYGDASNIPQIAVNAQGRITAAANVAVAIISGHEHVYQEDLSARCNGSATLFYTANAYEADTTQVWINGVLERPGTQYTEDAISYDTLTLSSAPIAGDEFVVSYTMAIP